MDGEALASPSGGLRVGCAMWALPAWRGRWFADGPDLERYASWCSAVEGNTTFYALPPSSTVARWAELTPPSFRFCFKLPKAITHERRLRQTRDQVLQFAERLAPLGPRLGPVSIQLPPGFGPPDLGTLAAFLEEAPSDLDWSVEVRHPDFFGGGRFDKRLNELLAERGVDRCVFDTSAFFAGPTPASPAEAEAYERKPRHEVRPIASGRHPIVRWLGETDPEANPPLWQRWIRPMVRWIQAGREPYVFIHTPDNTHAPELARRFHADVAAQIPELEALPSPRRPPLQVSFTVDEATGRAH